jgi:hypothetical protein
MSLNPVIALLGRRLRLAVIGGGPGSFIGAMHRQAARLDDRYELVAAALSADPLRAARKLACLPSVATPVGLRCWMAKRRAQTVPTWWPS